MKYVYFALVGFLGMSTIVNTTASAQPHPEPVEYVLGAAETVVPRGESLEEFDENIEVRQAGGRTNRWITGVTTPSLTLYVPAGKPTAAAVICPGGGYGGLAFDKEGTFVAEWLRERGMAAGVLKYTVVGPEWPTVGDNPLRAAQYAIQYLKHRLNVKVGIVGFSAGGHVAASAANHTLQPRTYDGASAIIWQASRPAFQALIYPVISMRDGVTHGGSRRNLLGESPSEELIGRFSMDEHVTAGTPPAFVVHTADDTSVPLANSLRYTAACQEAGVPVELHVYPTGGHGYGMWSEQGTVAGWPVAFEAWLRERGLLDD